MSLYALNTYYNGSNKSTYISVNLTAGAIVDGVGQCMPAAIEMFYLSFQGAIVYQFPAGDASVGTTIDATTNVAGSIIVSPAMNVDFNVTLWGRGTTLGTYTVPAGQTSGSFNFQVSQSDGIPIDQARAALDQIVKPPLPPQK